MKKICTIGMMLLPFCGMVGCQTTSSLAQSVQTTPVTMASPSSQLNNHDFKALKKREHRPIIALVLGSGGARGYAHIGAIEVLEKYGIKPDLIVGTSAGSIVGSLYASGKSAHEIREIALSMRANDVRDLTIDIKGFFDGKKVENYVNKWTGNQPLEQLPIPMYVVATELKHGKRVVFNHGNTGQAVRASTSIPSMFVPMKIAEQEYVDGGLVSPVPVEVARELGADFIIAVDILAQPMHTETTNVWGLFNQNINIMQNRLAKEELKYADIVIQPDLREKAHIFDVQGRENTMQAGVNATLAKMHQIELGLMQKKFKAIGGADQEYAVKSQ